jgi:hypothetical protein
MSRNSDPFAWPLAVLFRLRLNTVHGWQFDAKAKEILTTMPPTRESYVSKTRAPARSTLQP